MGSPAENGAGRDPVGLSACTGMGLCSLDRERRDGSAAAEGTPMAAQKAQQEGYPGLEETNHRTQE